MSQAEAQDASERLLRVERAVSALERRNRTVESAKGWETSRTRLVTILVLTYFFISLLLTVIGVQRVFLDALVPTSGYLLSTLSLPIIRRVWERRYGGGAPSLESIQD